MSGVLVGEKRVFTRHEMVTLTAASGSYRLANWATSVLVVAVGGGGGGGGGGGFGGVSYIGAPGSPGAIKVNYIRLDNTTARTLAYSMGAGGTGGESRFGKGEVGGTGGSTELSGFVVLSAAGGAGGEATFKQVTGLMPPNLDPDQGGKRGSAGPWSQLWTDRMAGTAVQSTGPAGSLGSGGNGGYPNAEGAAGGAGFIRLYMWGYQE